MPAGQRKGNRARIVPHVYRPQPVPHVLQRKVVNPARTHGIAATRERHRAAIGNNHAIQKTSARAVIQRMYQPPGAFPPAPNPPPPPPQLQPPPALPAPLGVGNLLPAVLGAMSHGQPLQHIAGSEPEADFKKGKSSTIKGIHSVLDSIYRNAVSEEICQRILNPRAIERLQAIAAAGHGEYHRPQPLEITFAQDYGGWEAREEGRIWRDMAEVRIRGCEIRDLRIWIANGAWGMSFHFIPRQHARA